MGFENRLRQTREKMAKGGCIPVYQDGRPILVIGNITFSNQTINALESEAMEEFRKAQQWLDNAIQT